MKPKPGSINIVRDNRRVVKCPRNIITSPSPPIQEDVIPTTMAEPSEVRLIMPSINHKKVAIVMPYYNRKEQLIRTISSINQSRRRDDINIIVVDDGSDESHKIGNVEIDRFPGLSIYIISVNKGAKTWINPCIPYNIGFSVVGGEIVIIQNPECIHFGDVVDYVINNINSDNYLSFSCYSITQSITNGMPQLFNESTSTALRNINFINLKTETDNGLGWYNHPILRPAGFHWAAAITTQNLNKLGGFDEKYQNGCQYDDNDLLFRVRKLGLKIDIVNPDEVFVIHQWHSVAHKDAKFYNRCIVNNNLYYNYTMTNNVYAAMENKFFIPSQSEAP